MSENVTSRETDGIWIPDLPERWEIISLKYCVECLDGDRIPLNSDERSEIEGEIPYWGAGGIVDYIDDWLFNEPLVLLGEDGAPFNDRHRPVAHFVDEPVWVNNHIHVLRTNEGLNDKYIRYALNSADYQNYLSGSTRDKLTQSEMKNIPLPVPPLWLQSEIVRFLDDKTNNIDSVVNKKKSLKNMLMEKKSSTIEDQLTAGLNASNDFGTAKWSNQLPNDWELRRGYGLFREVDERSQKGSETLLSLRKNEGLVPHSKYSDKEYEQNELEGYKIVRPGQMVMNRMRAATGLFGVASEEGIVSPDYAVFDPTEAANPEFYKMVCQTELFKTLFRSRSNGLGTGSAGFLRLHSDEFLSLWYPHPSIHQQNEIVNDLQSKLEKINHLIDLTQRSIDCLMDRRYSLVYNAVKGQIDIGAKRTNK